jgi:hypothetical protein
LILLATWRAVQRFKESFPGEVASASLPVKFQGEESTSSLIKWLRDTPGAVLVGTRSLWEGVDVAGEALSLVIVDKVPFPPPNDPVIAKLCEKAGSRWFMDVSSGSRRAPGARPSGGPYHKGRPSPKSSPTWRTSSPPAHRARLRTSSHFSRR